MACIWLFKYRYLYNNNLTVPEGRAQGGARTGDMKWGQVAATVFLACRIPRHFKYNFSIDWLEFPRETALMLPGGNTLMKGQEYSFSCLEVQIKEFVLFQGNQNKNKTIFDLKVSFRVHSKKY